MSASNALREASTQPDAPAPTKSRLLPLLLACIAVAYCTWIWSLPLFPTQDGPMHLYYARIMQALLFHRDPGIFGRYYTIKHLLPPYSLYYYLLLALGHFVSLVTADKIIICLYVLLFLFGFRYLARAVGPSGDCMALLATPLVLNWPLGMGFVNFCLSTSLALWALGLWCRVSSRPGDRNNALRLAGFVTLSVVIMLTHPVPLLCVLGFCLIELLLRIVTTGGMASAKTSAGSEMWTSANLLRDGVALFLASGTLIYVRAFTIHNVMRQVDADQLRYATKIVANLRGLVLLHSLTVFAGKGPLDIVYRLGIVLALAVPLLLAFSKLHRSRRNRIWNLSNTWLLLCLLLALALPVIPPDLNNSHFFSERLVIFIWIAALAGASGINVDQLALYRTLFTQKTLDIATATFGTIITAVILLLAVRRIDPVATQIAQIETVPLAIHQQVGFMLHSVTYDAPHTLTYDPFYWSGTRIFRRSDSILYNTPWLDLTVIPIGAQPVMPTGKIDLVSLEYAIAMRETMLGSSAARALVFPHIDMALINHGTVRGGTSLDPILAIDPVPGHHWSCAPLAIFSLCHLSNSEPTPALP